MHISFLIHNAYGIGGTIRATFNLAGALAEQHDVEIVSVFRRRDAPTMGAPSGIRMRHLIDLRPDSPGFDGDCPDYRCPARMFAAGDGRHHQYSRLTDDRIGQHLKCLQADVVVGTRPGLNVHIARQTGRGVVRVGQEHLTLDRHRYRLRRELIRRYMALDAITTVSEADARAYRTRLRLPGVRIDAVPNSVPRPSVAPADGTEKVIVAAGRLTPVKRFDLLIRSFAKVVAAYPEWRLRIYGSGDATGDTKDDLLQLIDQLGLRDCVRLMGAVSRLEPEFAQASIAACTSRAESFGMTIVEAMRCGLAVVSTDCPHGPREIITDGVDGRLVATGNADAIAGALLELVENDELRRQMGQAARISSARFDPARIAERHETIFTELLAAKRSRARSIRDSILRVGGAAAGEAYALHDLARRVRRRRTGAE